ncbi:MAG TPA: hypothetical protein VL283_02590 [Candidatus Baltobacteraceae bacterium]|nr:hypothetical protein [Candidatus Baltobacteraceae bacterium]
MKHVLSTRKLIETFKGEIALFLKFIGKAVPRTPVAEVTMAQFDDPYWEPLINWRGRMLGMERMLLLNGVTAAELSQLKKDAGLPEAFRNLRPHGDA